LALNINPSTLLAVSTLETGDAVLEATVLFEYNPHKQIEHQHFRSDHEDDKVQAQPWVVVMFRLQVKPSRIDTIVQSLKPASGC